MKREKIHTLTTLFVGILSGGIILFLLLGKILPVAAPFLIAWTVAFAVRGPARRICKRLPLPEKLVRLLIALFAILLGLGVLSLILWQISAVLWRFLTEIDENSGVFKFFEAISSPSLPFFGDIIPEELAGKLAEASDALISDALTRLAGILTSWVKLVPGILLFLLITLISLIYFTLDLERINSFVKRVLPKKASTLLVKFRTEAFSVIGKYIFSYFIILCITFVTMLVGFIMIGVKYAPLIALIVAALDVLPVIGVGTVLLPWSIFSFATGEVGRGVGLLILFCVNTVIRQLLEPKIVGKSLDLHPIITLIALYSGYSLFGIFGLILAPVISIVLALIKKNRAANVGEGLVGE